MPNLFAFQLHYDKPATSIGNVKGLYNGNISQTRWKTANDNQLRSYGYEYDALNRLNTALYETGSATPDSYNVRNITYDENGNIVTLQRWMEAGTLMDDLVYTYNQGNQLQSVSDKGTNDGFKDGANETTEYEYDANGNMTVDKNKGISAIEYNLLNLPTKVLFEDGGTIEYVYDANGTKLRKTVMVSGSEAISTDYINGYQYVNGKLAFYPHAEGYVKVNEDNTITYVYNYTDHLGNVRLSYADTNNDGKPEIIEESNYYPFGLKHKGYNNTANLLTDKYKYGYNGKEKQEELGLGWIDYQARNYDPALGRWFNHDPLSEASRRYSPYAYALDNPIYFIDPDGMLATPWKPNGDGTWTAEAGDSAATLAQDAGITYDEANALVQEQHGENYTENGVEKSAIDKGDVVDVNSEEIAKREETVNDWNSAQQGTINQLEKEITANEQTIEDYENNKQNYVPKGTSDYIKQFGSSKVCEACNIVRGATPQNPSGTMGYWSNEFSIVEAHKDHPQPTIKTTPNVDSLKKENVKKQNQINKLENRKIK